MKAPNTLEQQALQQASQNAHLPITGSPEGRTYAELTDRAFGILLDDLRSHGNLVGKMQEEALYELVSELTRYVQGTVTGRRAFSLGTGCGKTSAIVAWITALYQLGLEHVSVSVAASKVQALCDIKDALIAHGVPEHLIGLKYAHCPEATQPSTGNEDRRFQLVTHARVRGGTDQSLFMEHHGQPRALMIYDETLFRADAFPVDFKELRKKLAAFVEDVRGLKNEADYQGVIGYLRQAVELIEQHSASPSATPQTFTLPALDQVTWDGYRALVGDAYEWAILRQFLDISQDELRVTSTGQGTGVIWYQIAIPKALSNVLILDASHPIRKLVHLDPTIVNGSRFADKEVKRFDRVTIHQMKAPSGRHSLTKSFSHQRREDRDISREVVELVKGLPQDKAILIFTFKPRPGEVNIPETIRRDLTEAGIDLDARMPDGKPWFNLLTWGDETSLNSCSHCEVVILAGIVRRSSLDIAAQIIGQQDDLKAKADNRQIQVMLDSEIAHVVYQAVSRGSCRVVEHDQAKAMDIYLIHPSHALKEPLDRVMPGVKWRPWVRQFAPVEHQVVTDVLALRIMEYLAGLPDHQDKVATKGIKEALEVEAGEASRKRFDRAIKQIELDGEWFRKGQSLMRTRLLFDGCDD